jgi:hypothetical protein
MENQPKNMTTNHIPNYYGDMYTAHTPNDKHCDILQDYLTRCYCSVRNRSIWLVNVAFI